MSEILTMPDLIALEIIARAAERDAKVAVENADGTLLYGTARSIGTDEGKPAPRTDVRDQFLRITLRGGRESYWAVRDLMPLAINGGFAEYAWADPRPVGPRKYRVSYQLPNGFSRGHTTVTVDAQSVASAGGNGWESDWSDLHREIRKRFGSAYEITKIVPC